jgi:hypothetical protein
MKHPGLVKRGLLYLALQRPVFRAHRKSSIFEEAAQWNKQIAEKIDFRKS